MGNGTAKVVGFSGTVTVIKAVDGSVTQLTAQNVPFNLADGDVVCVDSPGACCSVNTSDGKAAAQVQKGSSGGTSVYPFYPGATSLSPLQWYAGSFRYNLVPNPPQPPSFGIRG